MSTRARRSGKARAAARQPAQRPAAPVRRGLPSGPRNDPSRVGVRELRQNLSIYLARVKTGEALTVTEHGHIVAMLSPVAEALSPLERLIAEGRATPATRSLRDLPPRQAAPGARASEAIIAELREERLP